MSRTGFRKKNHSFHDIPENEGRDETRNKTGLLFFLPQDNQSEYSQSETGASQMQGPVSRPPGTRTTSRISNQSSHSKNKRSSISSLPASLLNLGEVRFFFFSKWNKWKGAI